MATNGTNGTNGATPPKFIFFTDFDGTVTLQDSNDHMTDTLGFGNPRRVALNKGVLAGTIAFRDAFSEMLDSVKLPFDACVANLLQNIKLDPNFAEFYAWCRKEGIPVVVLSGGMKPIIERLLVELLGKEEMKGLKIVSNDVAPKDGKDINEEDGWKIVFHDESEHGHDKSIEIRKYSSLPEAQRPTMFYAGDGVSDLSAAKETDLLFAKQGKDLVLYCEREKVPFVTFETFGSIHQTVKAVVEGKTTVQQEAKGRV